MIDKIIPTIDMALALNYSGSQGNPATFETLGKTRVSDSVAVAALETNQGKSCKSYPVLDGCKVPRLSIVLQICRMEPGI